MTSITTLNTRNTQAANDFYMDTSASYSFGRISDIRSEQYLNPETPTSVTLSTLKEPVTMMSTITSGRAFCFFLLLLQHFAIVPTCSFTVVSYTKNQLVRIRTSVTTQTAKHNRWFPPRSLRLEKTRPGHDQTSGICNTYIPRRRRQAIRVGTEAMILLARSTPTNENDGNSSKQTRRRTWDDSFQRLVEYKNEHGDCRVPQSYAKDPALGRWVRTQRQRRNSLSKDKESKLNSIGFSWDTHQARWHDSFQRLVKYKNEHGDCRVPQSYAEDPALGDWVSNQRQRRNSLSKDKLSKLNSIGFSWDLHQDMWHNNYLLLAQYQQEHGNCNVPKNHSLWFWVKRQRVHKARLGDERKAMLDDLNFT